MKRNFFEPWRKTFDLFLKTAFYVSKGTFWVKNFSERSLFFQTLRNFERTFTVLGDKISGKDIKIEKCTFHLIRSIKTSNFWKFSFFYQFLQNFERTITVLGGKVLGRDIKIESCTLSLQSIMLRMKTFFESFVSFPFIRTWNKNFLDLWQQIFLQGSQNCTLRVYLNSLRIVDMRSETK